MDQRVGKNSDFYSAAKDRNRETIHPNAANLGFYVGSLDRAFEKVNKDTEKEADFRRCPRQRGQFYRKHGDKQLEQYL